MSATQELIAAALTAADELDGPLWPYSSSDNGKRLREACARAMVQSVDYMRGVLAERDALIADNERLMQIVSQEVSNG